MCKNFIYFEATALQMGGIFTSSSQILLHSLCVSFLWHPETLQCQTTEQAPHVTLAEAMSTNGA